MESHILLTLDESDLRTIVRETIREEIKELMIFVHKEMDETLLTRKETAELLKITLPTLHNYQKEDRLKSYRIGRRVFFKKREILDAVNPSIKYQRWSVNY